MAEFDEAQQTFVTTRLACYATPSKVRDMLKLKWPELGAVSIPQICHYNPLTAQGCDLHPKWVDLFHTTRTAHKQKLAEVPIADKFYRLSRYQDLIDDELVSQSPKMVLKALEQAAKEEGGAYTNRREVTGPGGKPLVPDAPALAEAGKELDEWRKQQTQQLAQDMNPPE